MGSPRMNLLKARVERSGDGLGLVFGQGSGTVRMEVPADRAAGALGGYAGKELIAGIRAEAVSLATPGMVAGPAQQFFEARIEVIEPTGADTLVLLDLGGAEFTVRLEPDVAIGPGQTARFLADLSKLVCFDPATEVLIA